jgi:putative ABC transport system ATP-binding protein
VQDRILRARRLIAERIAESDPGAVESYKPDSYNAAASLQDNVLFGRLAFGQAQAEEIVGRAVGNVLDDLGLRETVLAVGLDYEVGVGGKRLTKVQRQKLAIARALLKRPDLLIVNEATSVMDGASQTRMVERILERRRGQGVVWTLQRAELSEKFDRVLVMQSGRMVEQGSFSELNGAESALGELITAG